jgi:hypothetical protein
MHLSSQWTLILIHLLGYVILFPHTDHENNLFFKDGQQPKARPKTIDVAVYDKPQSNASTGSWISKPSAGEKSKRYFTSSLLVLFLKIR